MKAIQKLFALSLSAAIALAGFGAVFAAGARQEVPTAREAGSNQLSAEAALWPMFRGPRFGLTDARTARSAAEVQLLWRTKVAKNWSMSAPLLVNGKIYVAGGDAMQVLDMQGNLIKEAPLAGSIGYFSYIAYGDGKLFIPFGDGQVQAMDAETLTSLWVTAPMKTMQSISPLVYHDGFLYTGMTNGSGTAGNYFALDVRDEDPFQEDEVKTPVWTQEGKGYYWSGAQVVGNAILFGGNDGVLVSHSLKTGGIFDTLSLDDAIRAGVTYDEASKTVYVTTKAATLYAVPLNSDGSFGVPRSLKLLEGQGSSTSTPAVFQGRLYVGAGHWDTGKGSLCVVDTKAMKLIYTAEVEGQVQSSPLVTTAYANASNGQQVSVYFTANGPVGGLYCLTDNMSATEPRLEQIYIPEGEYQNYCTSTPIADNMGTLYYANDAGFLTALGSAAPAPETMPEPEIPSAKPEESTDEEEIPQTGDPLLSGAAAGLLAAGGILLLANRKREKE